MTVFLQSLGSHVAKAITNLFLFPRVMRTHGKEITAMKFQDNAKARYALLKVLNDDDISRIINCTSAYVLWKNLITTNEDTTQIKKAKTDLLNS